MAACHDVHSCLHNDGRPFPERVTAWLFSSLGHLVCIKVQRQHEEQLNLHFPTSIFFAGDRNVWISPTHSNLDFHQKLRDSFSPFSDLLMKHPSLYFLSLLAPWLLRNQSDHDFAPEVDQNSPPMSAHQKAGRPQQSVARICNEAHVSKQGPGSPQWPSVPAARASVVPSCVCSTKGLFP